MHTQQSDRVLRDGRDLQNNDLQYFPFLPSHTQSRAVHLDHYIPKVSFLFLLPFGLPCRRSAWLSATDELGTRVGRYSTTQLQLTIFATVPAELLSCSYAAPGEESPDDDHVNETV